MKKEKEISDFQAINAFLCYTPEPLKKMNPILRSCLFYLIVFSMVIYVENDSIRVHKEYLVFLEWCQTVIDQLQYKQCLEIASKNGIPINNPDFYYQTFSYKLNYNMRNILLFVAMPLVIFYHLLKYLFYRKVYKGKGFKGYRGDVENEF